MAHVEFTVFGKPAQMGSKRAFVRGNRAILTDDNSKQRKQWANAVSAAAAEAMNGAELFSGPVCVECVFMFSRPKSHFGTGRNAGVQKDSAPALHSQSPDLDKLVRCLLDAMSSIVYVDDRQVWQMEAQRQWTRRQAGAVVKVKHYER